MARTHKGSQTPHDRLLTALPLCKPPTKSKHPRHAVHTNCVSNRTMSAYIHRANQNPNTEHQPAQKKSQQKSSKQSQNRYIYKKQMNHSSDQHTRRGNKKRSPLSSPNRFHTPRTTTVCIRSGCGGPPAPGIAAAKVRLLLRLFDLRLRLRPLQGTQLFARLESLSESLLLALILVLDRDVFESGPFAALPCTCKISLEDIQRPFRFTLGGRKHERFDRSRGGFQHGSSTACLAMRGEETARVISAAALRSYHELLDHLDLEEGPFIAALGFEVDH